MDSRIKTWHYDAALCHDSEVYLEWLAVLGIKPDGENSPTGWIDVDSGKPTTAEETIVGAEYESPYRFARELREAAGCPESGAYPYSAVNRSAGYCWCWGTGIIAYMRENSLRAIAPDLIEQRLSKSRFTKTKPIKAKAVVDTDITLAGLPTRQDAPLAPGDPVILIGQTNPAENGAWIVGNAAWVRPSAN
jgi:hypothetical protein